MDSKTCKQCGESKSTDCFRKGRRKCRKCEYDDFYVWRANNKDKIREQSKRYSAKHKEAIKRRSKARYQRNSEAIKKQVKQYRESNPDKVSDTTRRYYRNNKDKIREYHKEYRKKNASTIAVKKKLYENRRLKTDPAFRLRRLVRNAVYCAILRAGSKKNGSILEHLPYSIEELRRHIESQFELWMNWDNWGVYDPDSWDDEDESTWTWHLDHIIRQADLPYDSFDHPNFGKCWALDNLRPYSSRRNVIETTRRDV
jgi:hypothetical protein